MAVVVFDIETWREQYPQFTGADGRPLVSDAQLQHAFDLACLLLDNTDDSVVPYDPDRNIYIRATLLGLLVCHLATLALRPIEQPGPMTSASEGSVSTGFSIPQTPNGEYYGQTACGQTFWQALRPYLTGGRYYRVRYRHPWG